MIASRRERQYTRLFTDASLGGRDSDRSFGRWGSYFTPILVGRLTATAQLAIAKTTRPQRLLAAPEWRLRRT